MNILTLPVNLFKENTMILWKDPSAAIIVDPGMSNDEEKDLFYSKIKENGLVPAAIFLTHAHFDHVLSVCELQDRYDIPVYMNSADESQFHTCSLTSGRMGFPVFSTSWRYKAVNDGDVVETGGLSFDVLHTPGHSPGSVCWYCRQENLLLSGDTLFKDTIGRTDLVGGDLDQEIASIMDKLMVLPSETDVYPGHGPATTIGKERMCNSILVPASDISL